MFSISSSHLLVLHDQPADLPELLEVCEPGVPGVDEAGVVEGLLHLPAEVRRRLRVQLGQGVGVRRVRLGLDQLALKFIKKFFVKARFSILGTNADKREGDFQNFIGPFEDSTRYRSIVLF